MSSNEALESMLICPEASSQQVDNNKKPRPPDEAAQKCPRCDSTNTKFCYYNNYSLSQPRYFCKSCKRYWTKGGTLRNVPVGGGGCRKNNKRSSSDTVNQTHPQRPHVSYDHNHQLLPYESTDLSVAFPRLQNGQLGFDHDRNHSISVLGNYANNVHGPVLDSMRCGYFLESLPISNGLQNVYYGGDHHYENVGNMSDEEMRNLPCEHLMSGDGGYYATTVKQQGRAEGCDATEEDGDGRIGTSEVNTTERQSSWINEFWF